MGLNCSSINNLKDNEYLKVFCSINSISSDDPIWNILFSHNIDPVFNKDDDFLMDEALDVLRTELVKNNIKSHNISSLIRVFSRRAKELRSSVQLYDNMFIWQAYNALFMIRTISKFLVESISEPQLFIKHFEIIEDDHEGGTLSLGELLSTLVSILNELPVSPSTYLLHLEVVNTLISLLSIQMFYSCSPEKIPVYQFLMHSIPKEEIFTMVGILLKNYINERNPPESIWESKQSGSIVIGVASGIWNILRQGVGLGRGKDNFDGLRDHNLGIQSLFLLLILSNHCNKGGLNDNNNQYRKALSYFTNENENQNIEHIEQGEELNEEGNQVNGIIEVESFKISYPKLFNTVCEQINTDESTLLFYTLLHSNSSFRAYIMARSDIENLVLPILKTLYNAPTCTSHHIYMSLIILLILSEDELFNQQIHDIVLKNVSWYQERNVSEITLGGLVILVVIRTIQYNISKMRDKYLHTNCLAALANMSAKFKSLHPYVSQRLVSLFETLAKRHMKLLQLFKTFSNETDKDSKVNSHEANEDKRIEIEQDISVLEEVIRMVLEILNSTLMHNLTQNKHLIYTLLYKRHAFDTLRNYSTTEDLVYNIDLVINYFTKRIGSEQMNLGVSQVMNGIADGILHWTPDILRKFPELKFRYVEEEQPEDFFIPYIWNLVYQKSGIYWSPVNLTLFNHEGDFTL